MSADSSQTAPSTEILSRPEPFPVYIVNNDGSRVAVKTVQTILGLWGAGLTVAGLLMGTVGIMFGLAWMRGPIEAVCIDRHWSVCSDFKTSFETSNPTLVGRYAPQDAGELGKTIGSLVGGIGNLMPLMQLAALSDQLVTQLSTTDLSDEGRKEVMSLLDEVSSLSDEVSQKADRPEVAAAMKEYRTAIDQVRSGLEQQDSGQLQTGLDALHKVSSQLQDLALKP
ncbi:hypothetical protein A3C23_02455 [Candidatus Roizmanbacteria bacterium RIFCSPHIGHO2_02_FULL_37_13b]|uniref:Uncharacterized protein n=1 Tax=Candidatus Roizmanbacteria bacterium RIFCSPLOWO2_02_FULL_36_11 TaxID=1802071 RepID=A0A1F7JIS5_9BACT|nr:MAG: hypothetical protein A3C23_02455 [Candidatus Roizmanbacteria bacterium RIFCSPHIGHO2_02_FULL_37_13b]OGK55496.1 MAG: hypothetical protein A3H78_05000 [Candidatus Roizmanbacteria bacterium RIFCSPLOWO2_02_FULL_36_11]